jgi:hypothetical protein
MNPCDLKTRQFSAIAKAEKSKRDAAIVEAYNQSGTIHATRKAFDFAYSREVVRRAISKAGVYDKCKRDRVLIAKFNAQPNKATWGDRSYSKSHGSELQMQVEAEQMLKDAGIAHIRHVQREVVVPGCQMRADLAGYNWAIEAKKECSSQGILTAMAQCLVYRRHLNKRYTCILLPDDIEPAAFYVSECLSHGIPIIKLSQLVWWVNTVQNDAQPN